MIKKIFNQCLEFGFKNILNEYKNFSLEERKWIKISLTTFSQLNLENAPRNLKIRNLKATLVYKELPLLLFGFAINSYLFISIIIVVLLLLFHKKQISYLYFKFKTMDEDIEKSNKEFAAKQSACNLYLKS